MASAPNYSLHKCPKCGTVLELQSSIAWYPCGSVLQLQDSVHPSEVKVL